MATPIAKMAFMLENLSGVRRQTLVVLLVSILASQLSPRLSNIGGFALFISGALTALVCCALGTVRRRVH